MGYQQVGKLIDKWLNDAEFRRQFRANPQEAIKSSGVTLSETEWAAIKTVDWNRKDEDLKQQISKFFS